MECRERMTAHRHIAPLIALLLCSPVASAGFADGITDPIVDWLRPYEPIAVVSDPYLELPTGPGLGIELDEDRLDKYGEKFFDITTRGIAVKTIREKGLFTALKLARKKRKP